MRSLLALRSGSRSPDRGGLRSALAPTPARPPRRRRQPRGLKGRLQGWCEQWLRRTPWLGLLPLLSSCSVLHSLPHQTLHVLVITPQGMEWTLQDVRERELWEPLLGAVRQLHPRLEVQISGRPDSNSLMESLRASNSRGLGPDLILLRSSNAVSLLKRGLIAPLPNDAAVRQALSVVPENVQRRVRTPAGMAGLPVFSDVTLACYDRRRLSAAPTTLAELQSVAASGQPIGISVDPIGIWWTAGTFGAQVPLQPIITNISAPLDGDQVDSQQVLRNWLGWLRQLALQSRVDLGSGPADLVLGLESGRLAWIPCYSASLRHLQRDMGDQLGVAPLPSGPFGPPSPYFSLSVWSLGVNSSPQQRRLAIDLASLSLNPLVQRQMTLSSRMLLPVNRFVSVPVASSGRLAALSAALDQFNSSSPLFTQPYSSETVARVRPAIEGIISQVMVGILSPEQGSRALLNLRRPSPPRPGTLTPLPSR